MKKFVIGKPFDGKCDFRETCFGICEKDGKILLTQKIEKKQFSLVGGGIEDGESHEDCLNREFAEEAGRKIKSLKELCDVDCFWLAAGKYPLRSLAHFYVVDVENDQFEPAEEGHKPIWIDKFQVKDFCPLPYHQKATEYYLKIWSDYDSKNIK